MEELVPSYTIQEVAAKLGIPVQKLRRWDKLGVLVASRTSGGHRRYPSELIDRLVASALASPRDSKQADKLAAVKKTLREKHRIIQLLLESEHRYRDLVETSHDLIWATDTLGRFTYLNAASRDIFGLPPNDMLGRCFFDFEARPSHVSNRRFLASLKRHGEVRNYLSHLVAVTGESRWVGINARVSFDENHTMAGIRGTARDITEQHLATQRIERLARFDPLTELPNRVSLQGAIGEAMAGGGAGAVLFIGIDHFKSVNDTFGRRVGDRLIVGVSGVLRDLMHDIPGQVYRLGGDEFAVLVPEALRADSIRVAERVLEAIRLYTFVPEAGRRRISNLTASIGTVLYPFHGSDLASLLASADIALYQAKNHGGNRHVLFDPYPGSIRNTHKRVHWGRRLQDALEQDRLTLHSQPMVALDSRLTVHHEVLAHLMGENGEPIPPSDFVEIAESLGAIRDIDLALAAKLLQHLLQAPPGGNPGVRYFVRLSRVSIADEHWIRRLQDMLVQSTVDPQQLVFGISETAAMAEIDVTLSFMRRMSDLGCRLALDDFGAGFGSFYYLKRFPVDYLRIDGRFARDLEKDEGNRVFVRAVCDVARGLDQEVIAKAVEDPRSLKILPHLGVRYGQGNLLAAPAPLLRQPSAAYDKRETG